MCGIAGLLRLDGGRPGPREVRGLADALAHRGPDGEGVWIDGPVGLAHRRLSIIDIAGGAQPMAAPDGAVLIFNGEIYNYRELGDALRREGWRFETRSDTEVLLAACRTWGVREAARRIDGQAAFALWDPETRTLTLARDRYGVKPLYLWRSGGLVAFASEIKAFFALDDFRVSLNREALEEYFTFQNLFRPHTLFAGVEQIPPGALVEIDADGGERREAFWRYDFSSPLDIDEDEAVSTLRSLIDQGVRRQLVSDVPVGAYLSGGLDSGALVSLASKEIPRLQTFTAGFEMTGVEGAEAGFDERQAAERVSFHCRTDHYEKLIVAGDVRWALPRVVWHLEDLRLGMSYPNYYASGLASRFVKVCLSGAGGDELFGGYPWRYYRVFRSVNRNDYLRNYYGFWQRLTSAPQRRALLRGAAGDDEAMFDVFRSVYDGEDHLKFATPEDHIGAALLFECKTFLSGLLLVGDKLAMAHGLEERFPFLDNAVVDFAMRLPVRHKLGDLEQMLSIDEDAVRKKLLVEGQFDAGKTVLRRATAGLLPAEVRNRRKQGFSSPEASWYRGPNAAYVEEVLLGSDLAMADYIDPDEVRRIVGEHMRRENNHRLLIWSLLNFEWWCRIFLGGARPAAA